MGVYIHFGNARSNGRKEETLVYIESSLLKRLAGNALVALGDFGLVAGGFEWVGGRRKRLEHLTVGLLGLFV